MKRLVEGIEIIGKSQDSGYTLPLYLIRSPDGRFIQLTQLLFHTVVALQKETTLKNVAKQVSILESMEVDTDAIEYLINTKLTPLDIIIDASLIAQQQPSVALLGLTGRVTLISEQIVNSLTKLFIPFFYPFMIGIVLTSFVEINIWLFGMHGIGEAIRQVLYQPFYFLLVLGLILLGTLFHEIGHATGCSYSGAKPSRIGAGFYLIWPAFFTDITEAYRLNRAARLRSDFGGIYFNAIFALFLAGAYALTHFEPLLLVIFFQNITMLEQLVPFLRLDGYYIVSDIVGVPNLFAWIKPILLSLLPGQSQTATTDLKPWVRWVVTLWVVITIPLLGYFFWILFISAPEIVTTALDSARTQINVLQENLYTGNYAMAVVRGLQLVLLLLPALGVLVIFFHFGKKGLEAIYRLAGDSIGKKILITIGILAEAFVIAFFYSP